ncbi:MAG: hypothetical protein LUF82_03960 [Clostridia bacterium]|nr:hypothetical protein [Clostridia bacterium]
MPFIDCKLSKKITEDQKDKIKTELGKAVSLIHKTESYLMVGIDDGYSLYFAGKSKVNAAYVAVNLFGDASPDCYNKMTAKVCEILKNVIGTDGADVYVTYRGVKDWGWNGGNF